jgi:peptidoglycan hydrolase CwlO-like protein
MTNHVEHTNRMLGELKDQYQARIEQLQGKITEQQQEILELQELIKLLTQEKYYDC